MKRLLILTVLGILVFVGSSYIVTDPVEADSPRGQKYSSTASWEVNIDSAFGNDSVFDSTTLGPTNFRFTGLEAYGSVSGYVYIEVTNVDTGTAAADYPDTTKDSVAVLIYSDWGDSTYQRLVYKMTDFAPSTSATDAQ